MDKLLHPIGWAQTQNDPWAIIMGFEALYVNYSRRNPVWLVNSSPPSAAYLSVKWVIIGSGNGLSPVRRHAIYLNQCWLIVNWTLGNIFQWNLNRDFTIFIKENSLKNVICQNVGHFVQGEEWKNPAGH